MTDQNEDRNEERGESPYRPQDDNTSGHGNLRKPILIGLALGAAALALGLFLGS